MEGNFQQTSFIPKKPITDNIGGSRGRGLLSLISVALFIGVILLTIGVFVYSYYVNKSIASTDSAIKAELARFDQGELNRLSRMDDRIELIKTLLNQHLALTSFFDFLGTNTLKNVRFSSFSYILGSNGPVVIMVGQAQSFAAASLQSAQFLSPDNQKYLRNPVLSDLNLDQSGNVSFNVRSDVNANAFLYTGSIDQAAAPATVPVQEDTTATTTPTVKVQ